MSILESVKACRRRKRRSDPASLRVQESGGHTALFTTLPVAKAWSCTMLEEKETELVVEDKSISLTSGR